MTAVRRPAPDAESLAGFTVAVTAARRGRELSGLLERHGARVVSAPALRATPSGDSDALRAATEACVAAPLDIVVVSTGMGLRAWIEGASRWGLGDRLSGALAGARVLARGPKARGALHGAGFRETWSPVSESMTEVLSYLLERDLRGRRIAVQLYGEPLPDFVAALRAVGAEVIEVPPYRMSLPADTEPLRRLVRLAVARRVDAATFTSAPAVRGLLQVAEEMALSEELLAALRADVVAACVGPVTAATLEGRGVPIVQPHRARLGPLVRELASRLPALRAVRLRVNGHDLEVRGHAVVVDGALRPLAPAPLAVLRALAVQPGRVMSRPELARAVRTQVGDHAIEVTVGRLRRALHDIRPVQTVVKRGYRLSADLGDGALR